MRKDDQAKFNNLSHLETWQASSKRKKCQSQPTKDQARWSKLKICRRGLASLVLIRGSMICHPERNQLWNKQQKAWLERASSFCRRRRTSPSQKFNLSLAWVRRIAHLTNMERKCKESRSLLLFRKTYSWAAVSARRQSFLLQTSTYRTSQVRSWPNPEWLVLLTGWKDRSETIL